MPGDLLRFQRLMQSCSSSAVIDAFKQDGIQTGSVQRYLTDLPAQGPEQAGTPSGP